MIPIVRTVFEPENRYCVWLDEKEHTIKIFGPNGWEPIVGSSSTDNESVKRLEEAINNLQYLNKGDSIDNMTEIINFLKNFKDTDNLHEYLQKLNALIQEEKERAEGAEEELNKVHKWIEL